MQIPPGNAWIFFFFRAENLNDNNLLYESLLVQLFPRKPPGGGGGLRRLRHSSFLMSSKFNLIFHLNFFICKTQMPTCDLSFLARAVPGRSRGPGKVWKLSFFFCGRGIKFEIVRSGKELRSKRLSGTFRKWTSRFPGTSPRLCPLTPPPTRPAAPYPHPHLRPLFAEEKTVILTGDKGLHFLVN